MKKDSLPDQGWRLNLIFFPFLLNNLAEELSVDFLALPF
jgi:hypothetical protein